MEQIGIHPRRWLGSVGSLSISYSPFLSMWILCTFLTEEVLVEAKSGRGGGRGYRAYRGGGGGGGGGDLPQEYIIAIIVITVVVALIMCLCRMACEAED